MGYQMVPAELAAVGSKYGSNVHLLQWGVLEHPTCKIHHLHPLAGYGYGYAKYQMHPTAARHMVWGCHKMVPT